MTYVQTNACTKMKSTESMLLLLNIKVCTCNRKVYTTTIDTEDAGLIKLKISKQPMVYLSEETKKEN